MDAAEFERLRVHPQPSPVSVPVVDVAAAVAAEVARVRAQEREAARREAEQAEARRLLMPSPCTYCGWAGESAIRDPDTGKREPFVWTIPRWGVACSGCHNDVHPFGPDGPARDDAEHRWLVAARLIGEPARGWLMEYALPKIGFRWWVETAGAVPGARFAYVDVPGLTARLVHTDRPDYRPGPPCPLCGQTDRWVYERAHREVTNVRRSEDSAEMVAVDVNVPESLRCSPCAVAGRRDAPRVSVRGQPVRVLRPGLADTVLVDTRPPR